MHKAWLLDAENKTILLRYQTVLIQTFLKWLRAGFYLKYSKINYTLHFLNFSKLNFSV